MKTYLLHFKQTTKETEQSLYWRCYADDYNHAIEQLKNEVETIQGNQVIFCELLKVST